MLYIKLFLTFLKIGLFMFGGGYAAIPLVQKEIIEMRNWLTPKEFIDVIAVAEMTPGPIAVNSATFIGYKLAGFWGGLCATIGVVLPAFLAILLVATFFYTYRTQPPVKAVFRGIRPAVIGLIAAALFSLAKGGMIVDWKAGVTATLVFFAVLYLRIHPIWLILLCGMLGYLIY
ncbi:MAG: chromate transporter [bacterium]